MYRGFLGNAAAALTLLALGGCVQFPRHSNTLVFGTVTSLGVTVGAGATSVPSISVGYNREEAVVMPLVANTADSGSFQTPCAIDKVSPPGSLPENCLLQGRVGERTDAYSVLASFGANLNASATSATAAPEAKVGGALAQYFATGVAAQILAANGGAAVISLGQAATESAANASGSETLEALVLSTPGVVERPVTLTARQAKRTEIADLVEKDSRSDKAVADALDAAAASLSHGSCQDKTKAQCAAFIKQERDGYFRRAGVEALKRVIADYTKSIPST